MARNPTAAVVSLGHVFFCFAFLFFILLPGVGSASVPFGITKISPTAASYKAGTLNITIYGARPGAKVYLLNPQFEGRTVFNCSHSRGIGRQRTAPITIMYPHSALIDIRNLDVGDYLLCYSNTTNLPSTYHRWNQTINTTHVNSTRFNVSFATFHSGRLAYHPVLPFVQLAPRFHVSGPIDSAKSRLCCDGPFFVGNRTYCTITAVDSYGYPTGTPDDTCRMRVCPLTDGRGDAVHNYVSPYYVSPGVFRMHFTGIHSGCAGSAGVLYDGFPLGNMNSFFTLYPGVIHYERATSECRPHYDSNGHPAPVCTVTQRDAYDNPVKRCSFDITGQIRCQFIHSSGYSR